MHLKTEIKKHLQMFIIIILYKLVLDFVYCHYITVVYGYAKFTMEFNIYKYILSIVVLMLIYFIMPKGEARASYFILQFHYLIMIIPMFTIYSFMNQSTVFFIMCAICFILQCFFVRVIPEIRIKKLKNSNKIFTIIVALLTVYTYANMIYHNGLPSLKALNFLEVYSIRSNVVISGLAGYLVPWQASVINPFMIVTGIRDKNIKRIIIFSLLQLLLYLIDPHKTYFFIPIAIVILSFILKYKNGNIKMYFCACIGVIFLYMLYVLNINQLLPSLFIRRVLFVPAQLKFFYYDFISKNSFLKFSEGFLRLIFRTKSPYPMNFANLIGLDYFNQPLMCCNTGYLASGYSQFGFIVMIAYSLVLLLIYKLIDSYQKEIDRPMLISLCIISMLRLNDGDLLTSLVTGGLLLLLFLLYLYYSSSDNRNIENINNTSKKNYLIIYKNKNKF